MEAPLRWWKGLRITFILIGSSLALSLAATAVAYALQDSRAKRNEATQRLTAESTNRLVCVTRPYITASIAGAEFTILHNKNKTSVAAAKLSKRRSEVFLRGLVTIPNDFDCAPLIAKIKKEAEGK